MILQKYSITAVFQVATTAAAVVVLPVRFCIAIIIIIIFFSRSSGIYFQPSNAALWPQSQPRDDHKKESITWVIRLADEGSRCILHNTTTGSPITVVTCVASLYDAIKLTKKVFCVLLQSAGNKVNMWSKTKHWVLPYEQMSVRTLVWLLCETLQTWKK